MRSTFIYILFGLAATSIAVPSGVEPAGELLPKLLLKAEKRQVSVIRGLQSREVGGGFIAVLPKDSSFPAKGHGGSSKRRRRLLRQEEVVVPDSLRDPGSKRFIYCEDSGYGLCPNYTSCCPLGWMCCSNGKCCPSSSNCVIVNGQAGCCPIGEVCTTNSSGCVDAGYVECADYNFCCKPGYTCYRDSAGRNLCAAPSSNNDDTDPTTTTTTPVETPTTTTTPVETPTTTTAPVETPTTIKILENTTTTDIEAAQATRSDPVAVPTTTPTIAAAAANTTSSASRTSLTPDIPLVVGNGAVAVTSGVGYSVLMIAVLFALGHVLVVAW
ncbi:hypothetical protein M407DRAFT_24665 [Tulasnella calospora MUT 4182]|uniref:Carbohydrate-binding module family 18 protein n=1 Tax=Tulasnella calospora MUT 4182 TaxID=1051891 RepID=A0A0C3LX51_9AGAM|nr:hypothetical protein M407DRAFT_24665 [Tulasnella calospora MUT 4182]